MACHGIRAMLPEKGHQCKTKMQGTPKRTVRAVFRLTDADSRLCVEESSEGRKILRQVQDRDNPFLFIFSRYLLAQAGGWYVSLANGKPVVLHPQSIGGDSIKHHIPCHIHRLSASRHAPECLTRRLCVQGCRRWVGATPSSKRCAGDGRGVKQRYCCISMGR
jgi:hypothetical protein